MAMTMCVKFQMLRICLFVSRVESLLKDPFLYHILYPECYYPHMMVINIPLCGAPFPQSRELKNHVIHGTSNKVHSSPH